MKNKHVFFVITALSILLGACSFCEKGTGQVKSTSRSIGNITEIELDAGATVYLKQGDSTSLRIETNENLTDLVLTKESGSVLKIDFDKCIDDASSVRIYLTLKSITDIDVDGNGKVKFENMFTSEDVELNVDGSGEIDAMLNVEDLESYVSGSGQIKLSGKAEDHDVECSGSGAVRAYDLITEETVVDLSGSGDCELNVTDNLNGSISGSGVVYYQGSVDDVNIKTSGSGKFVKR